MDAADERRSRPRWRLRNCQGRQEAREAAQRRALGPNNCHTSRAGRLDWEEGMVGRAARR